MKKNFASLTVLTICGALNFGLMNDAQAAELDSSSSLNEAQVQFLVHSMRERFDSSPSPLSPPPPRW